MSLFRNEIFFSKNEVKKNYDNFTEIDQLENWQFIHSDNIPAIVSKDIILFGWAWDCRTGEAVSKDFLSDIVLENYLEKTAFFSGRYIILYKSKYLFTDATSSFGIYFTDTDFSTNFSLLCEQKGFKQDVKIGFKSEFFLAPTTKMPKIKRLIPGQYLNLELMEAKSFSNFIKVESIESVEKQLDLVAEHLINSAKGIYTLTKNDFRLMLTAGSDSRLSFLAFYKAVNASFKSLTHSKNFFLNDADDMAIPKKIAKKLKIDHQITSKNSKVLYDLNLKKHCAELAGEREPGSTNYYYKNGNWQQIKEEFLIDNYYETGRMHLHNKGGIGNESALSLEVLLKDGYIIEKADYLVFEKHIKTMTNHKDFIDIFYFIKNYLNVAHQFEFINFSHTPLIFCNSLRLFELLLSVPDEFREKGKFHKMLMDKLTVDEIEDISCNPNFDKFSNRLFKKIKFLVAKFFLKEKV